jgi:predicted DCC family thiol-disulfide oxidoreductase YuxK
MAIVYDGECMFCTRYVTLMGLRDLVGDVELVDARAG